MNNSRPASPFGVKRLWNLCFLALALHGVSASADSFTDRVTAAFNHEDPKLQANAKDDDEIHLTTPIGPITVFLDRVRGECQKRPETCDAAIEQLVTATTETTVSADVTKLNTENIYPVVRPTNGLQAMQATIGGDVARMFVSRPYISGAVLLYAIDTPRAIRFVNSSDLEQSGLTIDALDKIALSHVSRLTPLTFSQMSGSPGLWAGLANDGYGTSRLFDPKFWDTLEAQAGGPVAVALPTRDWLLAARLDNPQAIARLRTVAARIVAGEPTAVTSAIQLPWINSLSVDDILKLRQEAGNARPAFRERFMNALSSADGDVDSLSETIAELRANTAEVESELRTLNLSGEARFRNVAGALGITISIYGFMSGVVSPAIALGGLMSLLGLLHPSARKDEQEELKIQSKPAYVLVKANELLEHVRHT